VSEEKNTKKRWETGDKVFHYKIMQYLASEPMGEIYLAKDTQLDRMVAVKRFAFNADMEMSDDAENRLKNKFLEDVKRFSKWDHPNLSQIYFFDLDDDNIPFYTMEAIPDSLGKHIGLVKDAEGDQLESETKRFDYQEAVKLIQDVCKGLQVAHDAGVGHYRISPNNIMITSEGVPKLVSFGLESGMRPEESSKLQQRFSSIYSAPEQLMGKSDKISLKTDLYTLGLILYELMSGNIPKGVIEPVSKIDPKIPKQMDEFFESVLAENPDDRIENVEEMINQLEDIYKGIKPSKAAPTKMLVIGAVATVLVIGLGYGLMQVFSPKLKPAEVDVHFTPQIPSSIYENLEPLGKFILWFDIKNDNKKGVSIEISANFRDSNGIRKKIELPAKTDTTIGINPPLNIKEKRGEFATDRNIYVEWLVKQMIYSDEGQLEKERSISENSEMITMLALGTIDWNMTEIYNTDKEEGSPFALVSSWINPNDPKVKEVISSAKKEPGAALVGYQEELFIEKTGMDDFDIDEITRHQVETLYNVLNDKYEITYDGGGVGQSINLPYETIRDHSANCIELSVLMSSLLIEIGIQPIIVIVPNHAFVGWRIWEDEDEYNFVQTTMMGDKNKTFKDAYKDAEKMAHSNGLSDLVYGDLDVNAFGKRGIFNKSNSVKVLNINLLREYKDSKGRKIYTATPVTSER